MKVLISILFFLPLTAFANQGNYVYEGQQPVFFAKRYEMVYAKSTEGKKRLEELRKLGYECMPKPNLYRCTIFLKDYVAPEENFIVPNATRISFSEITAKEILSESETVLRYIATQKIYIDDQEFDQAQYTELTATKKVNIGPGSPFHFIINENSISELYFETERESELAWVDYTVEVVYNKIN